MYVSGIFLWLGDGIWLCESWALAV
jgi:hypothetical protein